MENRKSLLPKSAIKVRKKSLEPFGFPLAVLFCVLLLPNSVQSQTQQTLNIGAIFPDTSPSSLSQLAFQYAVQNANERSGSNVKLRAFTKKIDITDSFQANKAACELLNAAEGTSPSGVVAILAPPPAESAAAVQSIGDAFEIPVLHYGQDYQPTSLNSLYLNLYPHHTSIGRALFDVVSYYNWTSFALFYQDKLGLRRMEPLFQFPKKPNTSFVAVKLNEDTSMQILKDFRKTDRQRIIVDYQSNYLIDFLQKLQKMQMLSEYHHYIFSSYELSSESVENFTYGDVNFTTFQIVDFRKQKYIDHLDQFKKYLSSQASGQTKLRTDPLMYNDKLITLEMALIIDAVNFLQSSFESMANVRDIQSQSLRCDSDTSWSHGYTVMNYMRQMKYFEGLSGNLLFNPYGQRVEVFTDILEVRSKDLAVVGNWSQSTSVNITTLNEIINVQELLHNRTLRITTILNEPFTFWKEAEHDKQLKGNDRFDGYCIDLLKKIKEQLGKGPNPIEFNYEVHLVKDNSFGSVLADNSWNGMVGELIDGQADLAVAPLTINSDRQNVIDFSTPFMNLGISILYRQQEKKTPSIFSFLKPLHYDIWMYLIVSYIIVSMVLFVMARFTPYEWYSPHPGSDEVENQFTLINALWFSAGAMMQQGSEISPRALSTRIVTGTWYITILCFVIIYTAQMVVFLQEERRGMLFKFHDNFNIEDFSTQTKVQYGLLRGGSTEEFFKASEIPTYTRMWQFMEAQQPSVFVSKTVEGIRRVQEEDYAFLMESAMLEYEVAKSCNLTRIGGLLDSKFYGIGLKKNSPYTGIISQAILQLQDDGFLVENKRKWWKAKSACVNRDSKSGADDASALKLDSIGGIFYVLVTGTGFGIIIAIIEFIWKSHQNSSTDQLPLWRQMLYELLFAFRCRSKHTRQRPSQVPQQENPNEEAVIRVNHSSPPRLRPIINNTSPISDIYAPYMPYESTNKRSSTLPSPVAKFRIHTDTNV